MQHYTVQDIMALNPCQPTEDDPDDGYPEHRIRDLFGDRQSVTPLDICDDDRVPIVDRLWVLHRLLPDQIVHEAACRYAERALGRAQAAGRDQDPRSWAAIEAKWQWLLGEISDGDLCAVRNAAWDAWNAAEYDTEAAERGAAWAASTLASWYAAEYAARVSAESAALAVTWTAVGRADWAATRDVTRAAERRWQLDTLREMIEEMEDRNQQRKGNP